MQGISIVGTPLHSTSMHARARAPTVGEWRVTGGGHLLRVQGNRWECPPSLQVPVQAAIPELALGQVLCTEPAGAADGSGSSTHAVHDLLTLTAQDVDHVALSQTRSAEGDCRSRLPCSCSCGRMRGLSNLPVHPAAPPPPSQSLRQA